MNGMSDETKTTPPSRLSGVDAGSQALAEALRSSFAIVKVVMVLLVIAFLFSGFFTVGPQEKAIILRFGKPLGHGEKALLGAGAHWAFPYPIDEVVHVPIAQVQQIESSACWYHQTPEQEALGQEPPASAFLDPLVDGYALTADTNIIHLKATLSFNIEDPIRYVFDFESITNAVQNVLNTALLDTAARFTVDDILTQDRLGFQDAVRHRVEELIQIEQLGIIIQQFAVDSQPPIYLKQAFDDVVTAGQNRQKLLIDARNYENQVTNNASAEVTSKIDIAEAEQTQLIQRVTSDANNFRKLLPEYETNADLFRQQWLVATMSRVLTNVQEKIYVAERADGKPRELRLLLSRELPKSKAEETK
jgi:modulator of FtsH protease HflK